MSYQTDRSFVIRRFNYILPIAVALISLFILLPHSSEAKPQAGIRYVAISGADSPDCSSTASPCLTVQYAVDRATDGDAIHIAAGTYTGVTSRAGTYQHVYISKTLMIQGGYTTTDSFAASNSIANPTILDAQSGGRVLLFSGVDGEVSNLTVQNGNVTDVGGGISASNALTLTDVTVISNYASYYGGGVYALGAATLNGGAFQNNNGGGLYASSTLALTGTQFLSNTAEEAGGAWAGGAATLNEGVFRNNSAALNSGGGLVAKSTLALADTQFISNTASGGWGGGAIAYGATTLNGGLFQNNSAFGGGGLYTLGTLTLTSTQFISDAASFGGGAIAEGTATLNGGLFQNNHSQIYGGGLEVYSDFALTGTQFLGNISTRGGGIHQLDGNGRIVNALFARNVATSTVGAGLYLSSSGHIQILHTTIASPTLSSGSAIYIGTGLIGITDTIISNYSIGLSQNGTGFENYNLFFGTTLSKTGSFVAGSGVKDVIGDPRFVDPANDNYHLKVGAAIGRGIDAGVSIDLDGNARPGVAGFDIGAYQYTGALFRIYLPLVLKNH